MRGVLALLLVAVVATGCAGAHAQERDGVRLLVGPAKDWAREAAIESKLRVGPGNCIGAGRDESHFTLVVWPSGTTLVHTDPVTIHIPTFGYLTVGEAFTAGGGEPGPQRTFLPFPTTAGPGERGSS